MRNAFISEVSKIAESDDRIVILSGDIGNRMFDNFSTRYPGRFINVGIAEANMTGAAAGMAMSGLRPFTYTIASFNPGRCAEQIRLDVCQHNLPVIIVGVGAGLSYAALGPTHHALEDIAWMRSIPNITVLCPADAMETRLAVRAAIAHNGPVYLRLGKKGEPSIHEIEPSFKIGKSIMVRDGADAAVLAVGTILSEVLTAAKILSKLGIEITVYSFHTIKPIDSESLKIIFERFKLVAVVEEHVAAGGAWSAVAEWLALHEELKVPLLRFGTKDSFFHEAGNQTWARKCASIDSNSIASIIANKLGKVVT